MKKQLLTMMVLLMAMVTKMSAQSTEILFDDLRMSMQSFSPAYGICTNDKYIYFCHWKKSSNYDYMFFTRDLYGEYIDGGGFNIPGITGIYDLTTDGKYFYGGSNTDKIYQMDFENHTLVSTITCEGATVRHIAYDPARDAFWVGGWTSLALYDRSGNKLLDGPTVPNAGGSSYLKDENGVEHLLLFCTPNANDAKVYDYNITTNTLSANPFFDYASNPNYVEGKYAGGCHIGLLRGRLCFFGLVQGNTIGIYPIKNAAYESNIVFHDDFEFGTKSSIFNHNTTNWTNVSSKSSDWQWRRTSGTNETSGLTPFNGNYYITNIANGNDIIASPILDLSEYAAATLKLQYANNSSQLSVLYRVNKNHTWSVLYTSEESHNTWTEIELSLPEICSTYQIGLAAYGNNGFVSVDDVTITNTHKHTYVPEVTPASCEEGGYTTFTCSECGNVYVGNKVSALGHLWGDWTNGTPATCVAGGTEERHCERDGTHFEEQNTKPLGHDFSKVVDNDEGHVTMCTRCDALYMVEKTVAVCDSYQWDKDGSTYTTSQTATTVINDVTYKLYLTVNHSTSEIRNATVTIGQQYIDEKYPDGFNFTVTANTPTTQYYTTTNIEGCDHVITLNLTIQNPGISVMAANFPDPNFRDYLLNGMYYDSASGYNVRVDKNEDGYLSDEELNTPSLEFGRYYFAPNAISSVKGIELFPALKKVTCYGNNLAGAAVDEMISLLPTRSGNDGVLYFEQAGYERVNRITAQQIAAAKAKGWKVLGEFGGNWVESVGLTLPLYFEFNVGDEWDHVYLSEENIGSFKELLAAKGIAAEGSLTYDKSTHTLTIENLKVNAELHNDHQVYDRNYYEKAPMVGNLIVKGNNELKGFRTWYEQEYNIKGDGSLKITVGSVNLSTNKAIFDGPTLEVNASQYGDDQAVWVDANENVNLTIKRGTMRLTATGIPLSVGVYHGNASLTLDKRMKVTQPEGAKQFVWGEGNDYAIVFTDAQNNVLTNTTLVIETVAVPLTITVDPDIPHGAVTPNVLEADEGDIITLKCQPQTGYKLNVLTITMGDSQIAATKVGNDEPWETTTYQFTMPAGDVLLKGEYVLKDDTSGISTATVTTGDDAWYTVDGRRLEGRPTRRGIYIYNGQKVVK